MDQLPGSPPPIPQPPPLPPQPDTHEPSPTAQGEPASAPAETAAPVFQRMFEALLDPRAIHWMLTIGGGLAVLGLVIWLISLRVFDDPRVMAVALGTASLGLLAGGWATTLRTRFRVAGQALTFLACVILPLNLWFYDTQNLITVDQHLWAGAFLCVALYAATVYILRDPLFLYACEAGLTLTAILLLADVGLLQDAGNVALALIMLAFASIHLERAFPPDGEFNRRRYGLPLFWSGQGQLGAGLLTLLVSQVSHWISESLGLDWPGNRLTNSHLLAGGLWIAATYLYLYSDLIVRRIGVYLYLAGSSLLMAVVTLVLPHASQEGLIAVLAVTALGLQSLRLVHRPDEDGLARHVDVISFVLTLLPVLLGALLHLRATSTAIEAIGLARPTGWDFIAAMLLVAVSARLSAFLGRHDRPVESTSHFFLSAAALIVAAAGLLRQLGWIEWYRQAPALMLIPIGYIIAARLWRGRTPETPLARVSHAATGVILVGSFFAAIEHRSSAFFTSLLGRPENLYLGVAFLEATLFYVLAGLFRSRAWNAWLASLASCGAAWQFLGYFGVHSDYYPLIYAALGLAGLIIARGLGVHTEPRYSPSGDPYLAVRGRGRTAMQAGHVVVTVALVVAFLQGLLRLAGTREWFDLARIGAMIGAGCVAAVLSPTWGWRRWYIAASMALAGVGFLTLNLLIDLNGWQKLEIFCVGLGSILLLASHIGLFREAEQHSDSVSLGLWLGSFLLTGPLFIAMLHHRFWQGEPSLMDELGLLTATILLVVSGCSWQIRASTLLGGTGLVVYLLILVGSLAYRPETAVGVYLLVGGGLIFAAGVLLSIYRERLMELPERIARREGIFRVIGWR